MNRWFGDGPFHTRILKTALPIMAQGFVTSSINFIDGLMTGMLGSTAVGAVAAASRFYMLMNSAAGSVSATAGIYVSQYCGAGRRKETVRCLSAGLCIITAVILPFFLAVSLFPERIIGFFNSDPGIVEAGVQYLRILRWSYLPLGFSFLLGGYFQAVGKPRFPLSVSAAAAAVKILGNIALMGNMGIKGAALASVLARITEFTLYVLLFAYKEKEYVHGLHSFAFSGQLAKGILVKAIPFTVNNLLWSMGNSMVLKVYGSLGADSYNAYAILAAITDIFYVFNNGYGSANSILMARELGRNDSERARTYVYQTYGLAAIVGIVMCLGIFLSNFLVPLIYARLSPEILGAARMLVILQSCTFLLYELSMQSYFVFRAGGDTRSIIIMDALVTWLIQIPLLYAAAYFLHAGIISIFLASQAAEAAKLLISQKLLRKEHWLHPLVA